MERKPLKIVTVCYANIERSPLMAAFIKRELGQNIAKNRFQVFSMGVEKEGETRNTPGHRQLIFWMKQKIRRVMTKHGLEPEPYLKELSVRLPGRTEYRKARVLQTKWHDLYVENFLEDADIILAADQNTSYNVWGRLARKYPERAEEFEKKVVTLKEFVAEHNPSHDPKNVDISSREDYDKLAEEIEHLAKCFVKTLKAKKMI